MLNMLPLDDKIILGSQSVHMHCSTSFFPRRIIMSDFLYYCAKCNSLVADTYEDDDLACEKCLATPI